MHFKDFSDCPKLQNKQPARTRNNILRRPDRPSALSWQILPGMPSEEEEINEVRGGSLICASSLAHR